MQEYKLKLPLHDGNVFHIDMNHNTSYNLDHMMEVLQRAHDMHRLLEKMCDAYQGHQLLLQNPDYNEARELLDKLKKLNPS